MGAMMRPSRIFLCDHLLKGIAGHHLGYNLALADAALRSGVSPVMLTHRDFDTGLADGCPAHTIFRTDHRFDPPEWIARDQRLLAGLARWSSFRFGRDLKRLPAMGSDDALFAQMLAPRHFLKWLSWFRSLKEAPVLFLHLGYAPEKFTAPEVAKALRELKPSQRSRIFPVTDSEKLVPAFGEILGTSVHYLPHIISYEIPAPTPRNEERPFVVFAPGNARREKGFQEVYRSMESLAGSEGCGKIAFQIQCHDPDAACAAILRDGPRSINGVEWIPRPLSDEEYANRLAGADVIMLPYHLDQYTRRTSGIFCEARVAGKPVITTRGSWAGDRVQREGGGWLVEERDVHSLSEALRCIPAEFVQRSSEAVALSTASREEFHRDHFMQGMLDLFARAA
jgi:glycosyltransferase involved in cell wall biosynthesis